MKFSISTVVFQEMIAKASRGASNNSSRPITCLMGIELSSGTLTLTTTDYTNYLYITESGVTGDDFYVSVELDKICKLIPKITSETITVELADKFLQITGNGSYKIELPMDDTGVIKYPNPAADAILDKIADISLVDIKTVLASIRPSLALTPAIPYKMHYYVGDSVLGADETKASLYNKQLLDDTPRLIHVNMMNLLDLMKSDDIEVYADDTRIKFVSDSCTVYGVMPTGVESYNVEGLNTLLNSDMPYQCQISKQALLGTLDRIKLFVGAYDEGAITLEFTGDKLTIFSKLTTGVESIEYEVAQDNDVGFTCEAEINSFTTQVHSQIDDTVTLQFGVPNVIKFIGDDTVSVVALYH